MVGRRVGNKDGGKGRQPVHIQGFGKAATGTNAIEGPWGGGRKTQEKCSTGNTEDTYLRTVQAVEQARTRSCIPHMISHRPFS